jgi:hypothetical protein
MKKYLALISIVCATNSLGGVSIGGGSGSSKALPDLVFAASILESLPAIHVDTNTLRRAEARLSVDGVEAVDMPMELGETLTVRRLYSSIVDVDITKKVLPQ